MWNVKWVIPTLLVQMGKWRQDDVLKVTRPVGKPGLKPRNGAFVFVFVMLMTACFMEHLPCTRTQSACVNASRPLQTHLRGRDCYYPDFIDEAAVVQSGLATRQQSWELSSLAPEALNPTSLD